MGTIPSPEYDEGADPVNPGPWDPEPAPLNLRVTFTGVSNCPGGPWPPSPDGGYTFVQDGGNKERWQHNGPVFQMTYDLAGGPILGVSDFPAGFAHFQGNGLLLVLANVLACGFPNVVSDGGTATLSWGPEI